MIETETTILKKQKEISIFRTSITNFKEIQQVASLLNLIVGKRQWNFDLEDVDCILRIHANIMINGFLVNEIEKLGFKCEELF